MLNTPVLFLVFNRPETTRQVFEAIRKAQPRQLFVAADGPRADTPGEKEKCEEVRRIATAVDWDCEVKTLFREKNLGCGRGPATAITWFFENVEQGIILEDDCLPSQSFFPFCEELLEKFKQDNRIMLISGINLLDDKKTESSYLFSHYAGTWGWATWKRAWTHFDYKLIKWKDKNFRKKILGFFKNKNQQKYFENIFEKTFQNNNVSWWDYQWFFARIESGNMGIIPAQNLITNIGFGTGATHTFDVNSFQAKLRRKELVFPLQHPLQIEVNESYDDELIFTMWGKIKKEKLFSRVKNVLLRK